LGDVTKASRSPSVTLGTEEPESTALEDDAVCGADLTGRSVNLGKLEPHLLSPPGGEQQKELIAEPVRDRVSHCLAP